METNVMADPYEETVETLRRFLGWEGYVRCDIPACNCGSWHGRYGLHARWREVKDALAEAGHPLTNDNGNTPLRALRELIAERDALRAAVPATVARCICSVEETGDGWTIRPAAQCPVHRAASQPGGGQ